MWLMLAGTFSSVMVYNVLGSVVMGFHKVSGGLFGAHAHTPRPHTHTHTHTDTVSFGRTHGQRYERFATGPPRSGALEWAWRAAGSFAVGGWTAGLILEENTILMNVDQTLNVRCRRDLMRRTHQRTHVHTHTHTHTHARTHTRTHARTHTHPHTHTHTQTPTNTHLLTHSQTHKHTNRLS